MNNALLPDPAAQATPDGPARGLDQEPVCRMCGSRRLRDLGQVKGYAFRVCRRCAFVFTPLEEREPMRANDDAFYRDAPEEGWAQGTLFLEPALERLGSRRLTILDFGTGKSHTPEDLRAEGHRTVAVDLRPPRMPHPDRLTGDVLHLPLNSGQFDLVYSFQVFEHLERPVPVLERLIELTRDEGLILIHTDMEVPERESCGFSDWWYVMPPQHCSYYRHQTFDVFFEGRREKVIWKDEKRVLIRVFKVRGQEATETTENGTGEN